MLIGMVHVVLTVGLLAYPLYVFLDMADSTDRSGGPLAVAAILATMAVLQTLFFFYLPRSLGAEILNRRRLSSE